MYGDPLQISMEDTPISNINTDTLTFAQQMVAKLSETDPMAAAEKAIGLHVLSRCEAMFQPIMDAITDGNVRQNEVHAWAREERNEKRGKNRRATNGDSAER